MIPKNEFMTLAKAKIAEAQNITENPIHARLFVSGKEIEKGFYSEDLEALYYAVANEPNEWFVHFCSFDQSYDVLFLDVALFKSDLVRKYRVIRYYTYSVEVDIEASSPEKALAASAQMAEECPPEAMSFVDTDGWLVIDDEAGEVVARSKDR